ncbi:hypothetical protein SDC9_179912 [bioreactor metagenome]|uniref:Uncharacterized protein n=1 Tax=bioreactor metagenome TaxID=1076179 RepID=A0A645H830_9ZZZZ
MNWPHGYPGDQAGAHSGIYQPPGGWLERFRHQEAEAYAQPGSEARLRGGRRAVLARGFVGGGFSGGGVVRRARGAVAVGASLVDRSDLGGALRALGEGNGTGDAFPCGVSGVHDTGLFFRRFLHDPPADLFVGAGDGASERGGHRGGAVGDGAVLACAGSGVQRGRG